MIFSEEYENGNWMIIFSISSHTSSYIPGLKRERAFELNDERKDEMNTMWVCDNTFF